MNFFQEMTATLTTWMNALRHLGQSFPLAGMGLDILSVALPLAALLAFAGLGFMSGHGEDSGGDAQARLIRKMRAPAGPAGSAAGLDAADLRPGLAVFYAKFLHARLAVRLYGRDELGHAWAGGAF